MKINKYVKVLIFFRAFIYFYVKGKNIVKIKVFNVENFCMEILYSYSIINL